jgi:hypothetical protein
VSVLSLSLVHFRFCIGRVDLECRHQALGVHNDVPLAAIDLLAAIEAALRATDVGGLDTLAVDDRRTRLDVSSCSTPHDSAQRGVDGLPYPV